LRAKGWEEEAGDEDEQAVDTVDDDEEIECDSGKLITSKNNDKKNEKKENDNENENEDENEHENENKKENLPKVLWDMNHNPTLQICICKNQSPHLQSYPLQFQSIDDRLKCSLRLPERG